MNLAIVGAGPAGLKAAETASQYGAKVTLFEGKPSAGRKFLVAGHGGLNLTHSEDLKNFSKRYTGGASESFWTSLLKDFGSENLKLWAEGLGIKTFIGTSGRVFPKEFKAAPLLRRWIERLRKEGVVFKTRHYLTHITPSKESFNLTFTTPEGVMRNSYDAIILALGGASWPRTGSTAEWIPLLQSLGISIKPFEASNCGWEVDWPDYFQKENMPSNIEGLPLKNIAVSAGNQSIKGELLITKYGFEGGALYQLARVLRGMEYPCLSIDLKPSFTNEALSQKISPFTKDMIGEAVKTWRLGAAATELLRSAACKRGISSPFTLASLAKNLVIPLSGPRPIAEAISSAGGVSFSELNESLMVKSLPGLFLAGEMLDWEAPTGGYLLQGCFSTGRLAACGAIQHLTRV